jgi:hypothetical protein
MRRLAFAALALGTALTATPASAQTYGSGYPVCLHVYGPATYYECNYSSIAQCNATASGRAAQCVVNPFNANAGMDERAVHYGYYRRAY